MVPTPPEATDEAAVAKYESKGVVGSWFSSFGWSQYVSSSYVLLAQGFSFYKFN
jgi:hypothetical protein